MPGRWKLFSEGFPKDLHGDVRAVVKLIPQKTYSDVAPGISESKIEYTVQGGLIKIPTRIYFTEADDLVTDAFTPTQKAIYNCFYSRSCMGRVREKQIRNLLLTDFSTWAIPYIIKLSDEYVIEIVDLVYNQLKNRDNADIKNFCTENRSSLRTSYQRMISYWNAYYRSTYPQLEQYVGSKLFADCFGVEKQSG